MPFGIFVANSLPCTQKSAQKVFVPSKRFVLFVAILPNLRFAVLPVNCSGGAVFLKIKDRTQKVLSLFAV